MNWCTPFVLSAVAVFSVTPCLSAKGKIVRIVLQPANRQTPIEVADPVIVETFNVWTGPGVKFSGVAAYMEPDPPQDAFIQWNKGPATPPASGLVTYAVSFFVRKYTDSAVHLGYRVKYCFDPHLKQGYIYLPGNGEAGYEGNTSSILHGVEGQWFLATKNWDQLVVPRLRQ